MLQRARKRLRKRAKRRLRGYPVATVALYGPDDTRATKLTVGIVPAENAAVLDPRRWFSESADIRDDAGVAEEVLAFIAGACQSTGRGLPKTGTTDRWALRNRYLLRVDNR
jgi:hypothetical protein